MNLMTQTQNTYLDDDMSNHLYTVIANKNIFDVIPLWGDGWVYPDLDEEGYVTRESVNKITIEYSSSGFTLPKFCFDVVKDI